MSELPDTTRPKPRRGTIKPLPYLVILIVLMLGAAAMLLPGGEDDPAPGEELHAAGVEDIAAGTGDTPFPRADASRFERGTREVRVYLRVEDVPAGDRMVATVERSGRSSALARVIGKPTIRARDGKNGRLAISEGGASGVVSFAVRATDGGALPAGGYRVEVRFVSREEAGDGRLAARKYFRIGDPQT